VIRIYNTLGRHKETFTPLVDGEVRMYVCGVTPYDLSHVGHARSAVVFDVIRRHLAYRGYRVRFVKNFTDVDDKIIRRANEAGIAPAELAGQYIEAYRRDMATLGVLPPDVEPKATEHIAPMIELIERLIARGMAYCAGGDVFFEVRRFAPYGMLSGKKLEELQAGSRVEVDERKRDPLDFALWKASKAGEPAWGSPWGPGRPGWHIECSAMAMLYLGESLDIHGGGEDLIFPHHENEIAQSEGASSLPFTRYWIHNGFVNLGAEKMSKSLGNTLTIRDLATRHDPEALRLYLLGTHYRHPLEFAEERIREARQSLVRFRTLLSAARSQETDGAVSLDPAEPLAATLRSVELRFGAAMDDDFNTPQAIAALFDLASLLHAYRAAMERGERPVGPLQQGVGLLTRLGGVLGLFQTAIEAPDPPPELLERIERLVADRDTARARRDWAAADALRAELLHLGVVTEDTPAGTRWTWNRPW
jgi:cysteinyl-tRNA synthetase